MHRQAFFRHLSFLFAVALLTAVWSSFAQAERRVALVIGNGAYKNAQPLPNPPNDAKAIADLLQSLGFEVVSGVNLTRDGMTDRLRKFAAATRGADAALFFYAGHGLQLSGRNYLVPVDADLKSEIDVKLGGSVDIEDMLQQTMSEAKVKLVFLDACRDNPFVKEIARSMRGSTRSVAVSSGLAKMDSGKGTLLAFATGPDQVALDGEGINSPFTKALLDNLAAPGLEIRLALTNVRASVAEQTREKQTPWENTNLTGFFYMNGAPQAVASLPAQSDATSSAPAQASLSASAEIELETWKSVKDSTNPNELKIYLNKYPNGSFASIARMRMASLTSATAAPEPAAKPAIPAIENAVRSVVSSRATEDALDLDPGARKEVQKRLTALGFSTQSSNGKFGDSTRRAIKNWQSARRYYVSGYINQPQLDALRAEPVPPSALAGEPKTRSAGSSGGGGGSGGGSKPKHNNNNNGGGDNGAAAAAAIGGLIGGVMLGRALRR